VSAPLLLVCPSFYFFPESPRWLLANNKLVEAKSILHKAIKFNGSVWPESFQLTSLEQTSSDDSDNTHLVVNETSQVEEKPHLMKVLF